ncbi:MAG: hypothetical protein GY953_23835, partial [bacterium]|nr:hypothetical protein [bacterium]
GVEPADFWSQSFTYGSAVIPKADGPVLVRFTNDGGKKYRRVEAHLAYATKRTPPARVSFAWNNGDSSELQHAGHSFKSIAGNETVWELDAGEAVKTRWVEIAAE